MYGKSVDMRDTLLQHTYEIEAVIGSGGCGDVYKAWHKRLGKHIVLKQLKDSSAKAAQVRRNEIEALKNIKSMYLPQVFDFLTEQENSFTVMEFVEGESLDKLIAGGMMFGTSQIIKWYYQLATALETLHKSGVCHRDIKPANIIQKPCGDVCLIDFNSALVRGNNTGTVSRSPGYASPEQQMYFQMCENACRERKTRTYMPGHTTVVHYAGTAIAKPWSCIKPKSIDWELSDIYSLGATMYHLYTGICPPSAPDTEAWSSAAGESLTGLESIIERSMRTQPEERFSSARELRLALLRNRAYKTNNWIIDLPC